MSEATTENLKSELVISIDVPRETLDIMEAAMNRFSNEPGDVDHLGERPSSFFLDNDPPLSLKIKSQVDFAYVKDLLLALKADLKTVDARRMALTKPLRDAEKAINDRFRAFKTFCEQTELLGKKSMGVFTAEKRRREQEAQALEDEKARRKQERLDKRSQQAAASGYDEKAEDLSEQASNVQSEDMTTGKESGERKVWEYEVVNPAVFILYAAQDPYLIKTLEIKPAVLKRYISDVNDENLLIPGLKIKSRITYTLRG